MISPLVDQTAARIRPLFDQALASALASRWPDPGALGRLEHLATHFGLIRGSAHPAAPRKGLILFASDHGVVHEGVTREAQDDSHAQARAFLHGSSPASVLARASHSDTLLVNVGLCGPSITGAVDRPIAPGSANFVHAPALSHEQAVAAMEAGIRLADEMALRFDVVGLGQLGGGSSCPAAAMLSAFSGRDAADCVDREPGLEDAVLQRRILAVRSAVNLHQAETVTPFGILRTLGGLDLAAIAGFLLAAAALRLPVIADGFISATAALVARAIAPDSLDAVIFPHVEPSRAHTYLLRFLAVDPLVDLNARQSNGFGAALGLQLLDLALRLHAEARHPA
jgi:nicotinate-nucleotide--dimethylbenzimidazole phosphoribosyltransferase